MNTPIHEPIILHTLAIFERTYLNLPPLVPKHVRAAMEAKLAELVSESGLMLPELEDTMIAFGRQVWAYNQAFEEFFNHYYHELGERLFLQKASAPLRQHYRAAKETGVRWDDLYRGSVAPMFSLEERQELHRLLVDIKCDIRSFAEQAVLTVHRARYEAKIQEFQKIYADIESELSGLRDLAERELDHPVLATEIRDHVRGFEYGLAFLGPGVDYAAVCNAQEHFRGRKVELKLRA